MQFTSKDVSMYNSHRSVTKLLKHWHSLLMRDMVGKVVLQEYFAIS